MPDRPDYAALVTGYTAVLHLLDSGDGGLPVLNRLLEVAQQALRAAGMSFAEHGPTSGRIVVATGAAEWALGRPVDESLASPQAGPGPRDVPVELLPGEFADQLRGRGLGRMLVAPAEVGGVVAGTLHAYYPEAAGGIGPEHHAVIGHLASFIAHLYRDQAGLPIHGDGRDHDLFVALTSHELRTPVTVIKGYAETLDTHWDSLGETDRREAARAIGQRASELARLLERLLSTADELGQPVSSPPVPFDLVDALRAAIADLPASLRERLTVDLPAELPKAVGDRASVATVLIELMTNAEKYSDPGTPIELTADADERTVVFRVSDRGIGIRPEHVERAFDRFWQGESGDRRRYPGVGLGLYLVRKLIERQNGWVSLRPREKGGTVAEVRLPRG
jgi:two-component sensor histidine kinase